MIVTEVCEKRIKEIIENEESHNIEVKIKEDTANINIENIVTPESVRVQLEKEKYRLKAQFFYENKQSVLKKDNLGTLIASPPTDFFDSKQYKVWDDDFNEDLSLRKTDLNSNEAALLVNNYCPKFVESVIIFEDHWFLITSFSCFIHKILQTDDCADNSTYGYQPKFKTFIRRKTRIGIDSFELTYHIGNLELLATSGFFGTVYGSFFSAFLGSSIHELPSKVINSIETITNGTVFISNAQKTYTRRHRIINQYFKKHS